MTAVATTTQPDSRPAQQPCRRRRTRRFSTTDKLVLALMVGLPSLVLLFFVVVPTIASVVLSLTNWDGIGLDTIHFIGAQNYIQIFTNYPAFWPAVEHNLIWLAFFVLIPTPFGILLAYLLDKNIRFSKFYQTAIFLPMVISL